MPPNGHLLVTAAYAAWLRTAPQAAAVAALAPPASDYRRAPAEWRVCPPCLASRPKPPRGRQQSQSATNARCYAAALCCCTLPQMRRYSASLPRCATVLMCYYRLLPPLVELGDRIRIGLKCYYRLPPPLVELDVTMLDATPAMDHICATVVKQRSAFVVDPTRGTSAPPSPAASLSGSLSGWIRPSPRCALVIPRAPTTRRSPLSPPQCPCRPLGSSPRHRSSPPVACGSAAPLFARHTVLD